ncbi:MAG: SseB family protein [Catenisphaera adipataccumulans]|jgi:hypothetical protein|uniref:SseB family protein n=1 Tax=Catenisphaera adipataccumulans TaxID=700500 RepID=UPI003D92A908
MDPIKEMLGIFIEKQDEESVVNFLETLLSHTVFIPVFKDGKPDILADMDGDRFYPVFTQIEEAQDEYVDVQWEELPFPDVLDRLENIETVDAVVVNPFTENVRLPEELIRGLREQIKTM